MTDRQLRSDLPTRFAAGLFMAAVASLLIYWGGWPFRLLVAAGAAVMMLEWAGMHRVARPWAWLGAALLVLLLLAGTEALFPLSAREGDFGAAWTGMAALAGAALLLGLVSRRAAMAGGFLYVAIPAFALLVLNWTWVGFVFWAMVVTWSTDILAYVAGRSIGGPKLAPRISPNKTWSGLAGGVAGAAVAGWAVAAWLDLGMPFLVAGAAMGVIAQVGDLYESWVKRRAGVKDSGRILPGHGGVLDRVDGLMPVAFVTFLMLALGLWG